MSESNPYDRQVILRSLVESVKRFREEEDRVPDLIFATGDIAEQGKAKEYESATKFFNDLLEAAGLNRDRLFIVPGNHDVDRKMGKGLDRTFNTKDDVDEYFDPDIPTPHLTQKLHAFSEWYNAYFSGIRVFPNNTTCSPVEIIAVRENKVEILSLNSALFCIGDEDHEKLFIGRRCLDKVKEQMLKTEADLKIALIHHPLDWLSPLEQSNIETVLEESVDLLLQGHLHQAAVKGIVSANGGYLKLAAGASYQTRHYPNSGMYATLDGNQVTIFPIRYEDAPREVWTLDTSVFPSPSYIKSFQILGRAASKSPTPGSNVVVFGTKNPQPISTISPPLVRIVKILIASPGDVKTEREIIEKVIKLWNIRNSDRLHLHLEAVLWESHSASETGERVQGILNKQIVDTCHCAVAVFWTRIGTDTGVAPGGAVEEVQRMLENKKPVMLYFSDVPISPTKIDLKQKQKLDDYRASLQPQALYGEYDDLHKFREDFSQQFDIQIYRWFCPKGENDTNLGADAGINLRRYQAALKEELGYIRMLGMPGVESVKVNLNDDTFVPLRLSDRQESGFHPRKQDLLQARGGVEEMLNPDEVMQRAFKKRRMLLVIGDPGSGKTTLIKYYALCVLEDDHYKRLGFAAPPPVFYLPLRDLAREKEGGYDSLPANLARWSKKHHHSLEVPFFEEALHRGISLVLLDGLDEISDTEERIKVCKWIDAAWSGFSKARFVVTSRATGYRKDEGIELAAHYERADVQDFTVEQQERFLKNWFTGAFLQEPCPKDVDEKEWLRLKGAEADERTEKMVAHLKEEKNKGLRQLAAIPMILQIMAILWKDRDYMPESRVKLYEAALDYLLEFRDKRREIVPLLSAVRARQVLAPVSLWMQEKLKKDEAGRDPMQKKMQEQLEKQDKPPAVEEFCDYLVKRAGLLVETAAHDYLFRHKSFREYLAGVELVKRSLRTSGYLDTLISGFSDDWWEEPIRFFIAQSDAELFDLFMEKLFDSPISDELTPKQQLLLQTIIEEAPLKKVDALCKKLLDPATTAHRQRVILDCLKAINKPAALDALQQFRVQQHAKATKDNKEILSRTEDLILLFGGNALETATEKSVSGNLLSFRNQHEQNAEYILVPGGNYWYSVTEKTVDVPDLYVAKYPVTNRLYRSFIASLRGKEIPAFRAELEKIARSNAWGEDFAAYLKDRNIVLPALFRSNYDEDRKFGGDDQPVVGITWYAAQAYCLWLSMLEGKPSCYRLPDEVAWEWAAGGKQGSAGQKVREYPWPDEKGEPNSTLANYDRNVGYTTPVSSYPEGATPEGLYDMAGNVWEWTDNIREKYAPARALRGGSWLNYTDSLRCSARSSGNPRSRNSNFGFRVVRSSPLPDVLLV